MAHDPDARSGGGRQSTRPPSSDDILERRNRYARGLRVRRGQVLGVPPVVRATLEALLDRVEAPALVIDELGKMLLSNVAARTWRATLEDSEWAQFVDEVHGGGEAPQRHRYDVQPLEPRGVAGAWLVIFRSEAGQMRARVELAARRWKLTRRQAEVLELLAQGLSNREIAEQLGCASRTIEVHVSAIIHKAGLASRTAAAAALWGSVGPADPPDRLSAADRHP